MKRLIRILFMVWAMLGVVRTVWALPTANSIITAQTPKRAIASFGPTAACTASNLPFTCCTGNGTGCVASTFYTVYTAGANGSKCNSWTVSNTDGSATHLLTLDFNDGADDHKITSYTTVSPPGAGTANVGVASLLTTAQWPQPLDSDGNPYFQMVSGDVLKWSFATAITASTEIDIYGNCADF